ncbi:MAG: glycosyltransferase family 2 protein [Erysipelotrichaceae bacterium]|nr:glycosyltransferase family 2 protein [Erysipelotrichaceae bacterium]
MDNLNSNKNEALVSIVMPAYNCADFLGITLDSIINQTYKKWEVIVVDDRSTDNTAEVVREYMMKDERIKYHRLEKNSGAAVARNTAVELAQGKYMAFLDSDDVWFPEKLTKQITFMEEYNYLFTCTSYTKIDEEGKYLNRTIGVRKQSDYNDILKKNPGNSTVVYNAEEIGKIKIPNIRKRNDYVMWLSVVKKAGMLYGMEEPLASHRIRNGSLSKKKPNLVGYHWKVYREIEKLSLIKSSYLIIYWVAVTVFKLR